MSTGYWLLDRPNPNCPQRGDGQYWGYSAMLYEPSVIVLHTTESLADIDGPDSGAENVASWFATNNVAASYHTLVDSDSTVRCLPAGLDGTVAHTAFHAADVNSWTLGLSFAMNASAWPTVPNWWYSQALNRAVNEAALWCARWNIPPVRTTLAAAQGGARGFLAHADVHPNDRSDPGAGFPWDIFLRLVGAQLELDGATVTPPPAEEDEMTEADKAWLQGQLNALSGTVTTNAAYLGQWCQGLAGEHQQIMAKLNAIEARLGALEAGEVPTADEVVLAAARRITEAAR